MQTVETEVVRNQTRLDGVDARLKKIENKLDKLIWIVAPAMGVMSVLGPYITANLMK
tara:strand:- start:653 stop:823 length:171 start_codon:yes stop_codon:yes gene_type:complete